MQQLPFKITFISKWRCHNLETSSTIHKKKFLLAIEIKFCNDLERMIRDLNIFDGNKGYFEWASEYFRKFTTVFSCMPCENRKAVKKFDDKLPLKDDKTLVLFLIECARIRQ